MTSLHHADAAVTNQLTCCGCGSAFEFLGFLRDGLPVCGPCLLHGEHTDYDPRCPRCRLDRWSALFEVLVLIACRIRLWIVGLSGRGAVAVWRWIRLK